MSALLPNPLLYSNFLQQKSKVFVSYHHKNDQYYYDKFSKLFNDRYDILYDNSADRQIDSYNPEYQMRRIREDYITGSSITVVLCGRETWKRKFVDWEICATLNKQHALLGIILPSHSLDTGYNNIFSNTSYDNVSSASALSLQSSNPLLDRSYHNCNSAYAVWLKSKNNITVPHRLNDNIKSGYALCINWSDNPVEIINAIQRAKNRSINLIDNSRATMGRNLP